MDLIFLFTSNMKIWPKLLQFFFFDTELKTKLTQLAKIMFSNYIDR